MGLLSSFVSLFRRNTQAATQAAQHLQQSALTPPMPPSNLGPATYPLSKMNDADKAYLVRMDVPYRVATQGRQIWFDICTDDAGKTWADLGSDTTAAGKAWQAQIVAAVNYADRLPHVYQSDPAQYAGPLRMVLGAAGAKYAKK